MEYLIPAEFFDGQHNAVLIVLLLVSIALVVKGADWLVEGAVGLSARLGIPKVIVGATIVSLGTTTPETAVSVVAAFKGMGDLALGNSVGSIICDTGLIFGICCLISPLPIDRFVLNRHGWVQFGAGVLIMALSFLLYDYSEGFGVMPRWVGALFIGLLVAYLGMSLRWAREHGEQGLPAHDLHEADAESPRMIAAHVAGGWLAIGLALVLVGSHIMVQDVRVLCERSGIPPSVIAATVIALGTSLPELVTALTSVRKGHGDLVVGNIVGADVLNVFFVTGAAACAMPLRIEPHFLYWHLPVMMTVLIVFRLTAHFSRRTFARWPGALLLIVYAVFLAGNYLMGFGEGSH